MDTQHTPGLPADTRWITEEIRKAELFDSRTTADVVRAVALHNELYAALRDLIPCVNTAGFQHRLAALNAARAAIANVEGQRS